MVANAVLRAKQAAFRKGGKHKPMTIDNLQMAKDLLNAGREAFAKGKDAEAHSLWRQAAALNPQNEAIWVELLSVVKSTEDRRVCLENILAINPKNAQAKSELQIYRLMQGRADPTATKAAVQGTPAKRPLMTLSRLFWMVLSILLVVLVVIGIELLLNLI